MSNFMAEEISTYSWLKFHTANCRPSVHLQGMVEDIHFDDVGLKEKESRLILVRLGSENEEYLATLPEMQITNKVFIKALPVQVANRCQTKLDLAEISVMPDVTETIEFLIKNLGIELLKGNGDYWIAGEMYQVAIAVKLLNRNYQRVPPLFIIEGNEFKTADVHAVAQFLNKKDQPDVKIHDQKLELNIELPYLVLTLCHNMDLMNPTYEDKVKLVLHHHEKLICLTVASRNAEHCQRYNTNFLLAYGKMVEKYASVSLSSTFPHDYKDLLKEFVRGQFQPILTVENRKERITELVYLRENAAKAETFIKKYTGLNDPSKYCDIDIFSEHIQSRAHDKLENVTFEAQSVEGNSPSEYSGSDDEAEERKTYQIQNDPLQLKYFYLTKWEHFVNKASYLEITLRYEEGCVEMGTNNPDDVSVIRAMVDDMLEDITTKIIPDEELDRYLSEEYIIVKRIDSSQVSVTGTFENKSDFTAQDQSGHLSTEKQKKIAQQETEVKTEAKKCLRRRRELLKSDSFSIGTESPDLDTSIEIVHKNLSDVVDVLDNAVSYTHSTGCQIMVGIGDITKLQVDAIVNAANKGLQHEGGLAWAIANAAGPEFNHECKQALGGRLLNTGEVLTTSAGRLPCKWVIHAVGPAMHDYNGRKHECLSVLKMTFKNCLKEACQLNCTTLALPAISAGIYGVNPERVAQMAVEAINEHLSSCKEGSLSVIRLIDNKADMIELFTDKVKDLLTA